ncbi:MAG: hypothetical protein BWY83_02570 [bacterium ADurb.Bin478]|nr:MAG: hypothetical protein BWY83_02570 [bacterium ADurb.Bin478]
MFFMSADANRRKTGRLCFEIIAIDLNDALGAGEDDDITFKISGHQRAGRIAIGEIFELFLIRWNDLHRPAVIHAQSPLSDVEMMGAPVGHAAAGVIVIITPTGKAVKTDGRRQNSIEGTVGGWAQPEIPIQLRRNFFSGQIAIDRMIFKSSGHADAHVFNLADVAVLHQFAGMPKTVIGPLHASGLKHPSPAARLINHLSRLADGKGQRFFTIDVLAQAHGLNGLKRMPVVRRGDHHRVDVAALQQFPVIGEGQTTLRTALLGIELFNRALGAGEL